MARLRVRLASGGRAEIHEVPVDELSIGSGEGAALRIADDTVAKLHARVLARRNQLILVVFGRGRTSHRGERIGAPVVLAPGEPVFLGEVEARIWPVPDDAPIWTGRALGSGTVGEELDPIDGDPRRFIFRPHAGGYAELVVLPAGANFEPKSGAGLPDVTERGEHGGHRYYVEQLEPGVRLMRLVELERRGQLTVPLQAAFVIVAQVAGATAAFHATTRAHGAIEPRMIHLGASGSTWLLRPGPTPRGLDDPIRRPFLTFRRRCGHAPEPFDDLASLIELSATLSRDPLWEDAAFDSVESFSRSLMENARRGRLDPARSHVARLVRLIEQATPKLATFALDRDQPP